MLQRHSCTKFHLAADVRLRLTRLHTVNGGAKLDPLARLPGVAAGCCGISISSWDGGISDALVCGVWVRDGPTTFPVRLG